MKRELQARQEPSSEVTTEAPEAAPQTGDAAFTEAGAVPEVVAAPPEAQPTEAAPTASEQAFEAKPAVDPEAEQKHLAEQYNDDHPVEVDEFNQLTQNAFVVHGKLDYEKVREFQKDQKLEVNGMVGPWTIEAAQDVAEARAHDESAAAAVAGAAQVKEEKNPDAEFVKNAEQYNEDHQHRVAEFNELTQDSCVVNGKLDVMKVRDFQKAQQVDPDGMVGPWTIAAAKEVAEVRTNNENAQKVAAGPALENKPEQDVREEKPRTAAVAQAEVKPEVVAPEVMPEAAVVEASVDKKAEGEEAAAAAKDSSAVEPAMQWNLEHADKVAEFNDLTSFANTTNGQLDIEKVVAFQRANGLTPDGRIGHETIEAAKQAAEPVSAPVVAEVIAEDEQAPAMA
jgi:peptidoglycan hydrolase-like protein with peptidoglycan-binding domain